MAWRFDSLRRMALWHLRQQESIKGALANDHIRISHFRSLGSRYLAALYVTVRQSLNSAGKKLENP